MFACPYDALVAGTGGTRVRSGARGERKVEPSRKKGRSIQLSRHRRFGSRGSERRDEDPERSKRGTERLEERGGPLLRHRVSRRKGRSIVEASTIWSRVTVPTRKPRTHRSSVRSHTRARGAVGFVCHICDGSATAGRKHGHRFRLLPFPPEPFQESFSRCLGHK